MKTTLLSICAVLCFFHSSIASFKTTKTSSDHLHELPNGKLSFIENKGQWDSAVKYKVSTLSVNAFVLSDGISFASRGPDQQDQVNNRFQVWNLKFLETSNNCNLNGTNGKESVYSYLKGTDKSQWVIHPYEYQKLCYNSIYNQIDLYLYEQKDNLKYDFIIHPQGKIEDIRILYEGTEKLKISENGELIVPTQWNIQKQETPYSYQIINGKLVTVKVRYQLLNDSTYGFLAPQGYDRAYDLIIDPLFEMVWSSYTLATGVGNNINYSFDSAMDNYGNVYMTGMVDNTFPITPGAYSGPGNVYPEVFVAKFSSDGTTLLYSTYLPGESSEFGAAIQVDDLGRAYVTGIVDLNITGLTNFPSTPNSYQPVHDTGSDAYLTVLNTDGTDLVYSTFIGGSGSDSGYDIALGEAGIAYVTGYTSIGDFPVVNAVDLPNGDNDAFVVKFDINQAGNSSLIYSIRIGGGSFTYCKGRSIALNANGNAFITGSIGTGFETPDFPITSGAYNSTFDTGSDGVSSFIIKLSSTIPVTIDYCTYVAPGNASAIAIDQNTDEAYIVGNTETFDFPTTAGVIQEDHSGFGGTDVYVVKMNGEGSALLQATFLGGASWDYGTGIALNSVGETYITGRAQDGFPTSTNGLQTQFGGGWSDFFAVHLNPDFRDYACGGSTYIGGSDSDYNSAFYDYAVPQISLIDNFGINDTICISGTTHSQDFPTTPGVYGEEKVNGIADQPVFFKLSCQSVPLAPVANFNLQIENECGITYVNFSDLSAFAPTSWEWSFEGGSPASSNTENPPTIEYNISGTYTATLTVCNDLGCDEITISFDVTVADQIIFNLGNDTTICSGELITLSGPSGMASYQWLHNELPVGDDLATYSTGESGIYNLSVTDDTGCSGTDDVIITVNSPTIFAGNDEVICGDVAIILSSTIGFEYYEWTLNGEQISQGGNTLLATLPGTYEITAQNEFGCWASDQVEIETVEFVEADFETTISSTCNGLELKIQNNSINATTYSWDFDDGNVSTQEDPTHYYNSISAYDITLIASNSQCSDSLTVYDVMSTFLNSYKISDIITPNGDGRNDCLDMTSFNDLIGCYELQIFNRWGNRVFLSSNPNECWYGKSDNGSDLSDGMYYLLLKAGKNEIEGTLFILR